MQTTAQTNWTLFRITYAEGTNNDVPTYEIASAGGPDKPVDEDDADFEYVSRDVFMDVLTICRADNESDVGRGMYISESEDGTEPREDLADILASLRDAIVEINERQSLALLPG